MHSSGIVLSIISPVYRGEKMVYELVRRIEESVKSINLDYEILLVEDGSPDNSWIEIEKICSNNAKVKGIKLSRNFGQHYAISAGMHHSKGEWIVILDCDLQERPENIPMLYKKAIDSNVDMVLARRIKRKHSNIKVLASKLFYKVFGYLTDTKQDPTIGNFGIYNRKVIDAILSMNDYIKYFPTMAQWVGFTKTTLDIEHGDRLEGESNYNFYSLSKLAFNNVISFSDKPLRIVIKLGFFISIMSFIVGIFYIGFYMLGKIKVLGFASLIISVWFLSGIIIFILGILGLYLGKVFEKVKERPHFIIDKFLNQ